MIETIFTAYIIFALNSSPILENCPNEKTPDDGCYLYDTKTIYINKYTYRPKDFVLYHEFGHHLFKLNYDRQMFGNAEVMADQFGLFIYNRKYPGFKALGLPAGRQAQNVKDYFSKYCAEKCVKDILAVKVPDNNYQKSFTIKQPAKAVKSASSSRSIELLIWLVQNRNTWKHSL